LYRKSQVAAALPRSARQDRTRGREMPSRKDFDVLDLAYVLGDLNFLNVLYEASGSAASPPRSTVR